MYSSCSQILAQCHFDQTPLQHHGCLHLLSFQSVVNCSFKCNLVSFLSKNDLANLCNNKSKIQHTASEHQSGARGLDQLSCVDDSKGHVSIWFHIEDPMTNQHY